MTFVPEGNCTRPGQIPVPPKKIQLSNSKVSASRPDELSIKSKTVIYPAQEGLEQRAGLALQGLGNPHNVGQTLKQIT